MANHEGFVFMSPDGKYLQRRVLVSHGPTDMIRWSLTPALDGAFLFPHGSSLDNIRQGEGFEDLATELDIGFSDFRQIFTPIPARSIQRIEIGRD